MKQTQPSAKQRKLRLRKIKLANERIQEELLKTPAGTNNWAFNSLLYLVALAKKAPA
jgi:hypothetical protein